MSEAFNAPKVKLTPWWLVLIEGILLIIIGIFLLTRPIATWTSLVWVIGLYWLISGVFNLIKLFWDRSMWGWKIFAGIVGIIAGYFLVTTPFGGTIAFTATVVIMLGLFGIFIGIANLIQAFRGAGWGTGILGIISIILGIIILSNQQAFFLSLPWAVGILAIIGGIIAIFNSFRIRSAQKDLDEAAAKVQASSSAASRSAAVGAAATGAAVAAAKEDADDTADEAADDAGDVAEAVSDAADDAADDAGDAAAAVAAAAVVSAAADEAEEEADEVDAADAVTAAAVVAAAADEADEVEVEAVEADDSGVRLYGIDIEPDAVVVAAVAEQFPDMSEENQASVVELVAAVNSLDPAGEKLHVAGVTKAIELLTQGASRPGRNELSKTSGIDASLILKWVNDLDLKRIDGIGVKYSDLLETAGVDTVVELAQRNPANLYKKLVEVNEEEHVVEAMPSEADVEDWVAQAKDLPRVITY